MATIPPVTVVVPPVAARTPSSPYYSHRTQVLLNYFDSADQRIREQPYTIDAQLLNTAAIALDDNEQRVGREVAASLLATCPTGLDNQGVYYAVKLDPDFLLSSGQTTLTQILGTRGSQQVTLSPYDDRLPIPSWYEEDLTRTRTPLSDPLLFDITGTGDTLTQVWNIQSQGPFNLAIPNRLTFWVENVGDTTLYLNIFVEGDEYPKPVWVDQQSGASETVTRSSEGQFSSQNIWQNISTVTVRGLPAGARLRCWQMPFNLPAVLDVARPFTHAGYRDTFFDRYWMISPEQNLLEEMFMMDNYSALEYVQSYAMNVPLNAICVEPQTWGLLGASGSTLLYWDRRTPLPNQLTVTALNQEPLCGVDVSYDITKPGAVRSILIRPVPYIPDNIAQWRYLVQDPDGIVFVLLPDGSYVNYSGGAGWQDGELPTLSLPLVKTGTYVITIECLGEDKTVTADSFPYPNFATPVDHVYDLSALLPGIQGIAYDSLQQLWVWTGDYAVPLRPHYDGYLLEADSRILYLTDTYDSVQYE